ncbi:MAG: glycosyltransferase family 2 protein [Rhizomicrobium sp.]
MTDAVSSDRKNWLLVVAIPALNEVESIRATVVGVAGIRAALVERGIRLQVFVIDDGSQDDTARVAAEAGADRIITHTRRRGLGAAVRSGLEAAVDADADIAVKFDADLQHDPSDILRIIQPILDDQADLVYGERFSRISYKMPLVRRWGNWVFRELLRRLTGWEILDSQPGIFAASRHYIEQFDLPGDYNYTQQILLDAFLKGMRFKQVSVSFNRRTTGRSFVSMSYPFKVLWQIVLVIAITRPMKIFGTSGAAFLLLSITIFLVQVVSWLLGHDSRPVENVNLVLGAGLFGLQLLLFGILAQMIVLTRAPRRRDRER